MKLYNVRPLLSVCLPSLGTCSSGLLPVRTGVRTSVLFTAESYSMVWMDLSRMDSMSRADGAGPAGALQVHAVPAEGVGCC